MTIQFTRATKRQVKLRLAIYGVSGSGKTATALRLAHGIGGKVALLDTEHYSASRYADGLYMPDGEFIPFEFDIVQLDSPQIDAYVKVISAAEKAGYDTLIIDSLSHGWQELLMEMDRLTKTKYRGNSFQAWAEGTPKQKRLIKAITQSRLHIIATMRVKTEWDTAKDDRGKMRPVKIGLAPEQGKGIEYEFDMLLELNDAHYGTITKDRSGKFQGKEIPFPGEELGREIAEWLTEGAEPIEIPRTTDQKAAAPIQESKKLKKAKNDLRNCFSEMMKRKLNGYEDYAIIRKEMLAHLEVDHLDKTTDDHIIAIEAWVDELNKQLAHKEEPKAEPKGKTTTKAKTEQEAPDKPAESPNTDAEPAMTELDLYRERLDMQVLSMNLKPVEEKKYRERIAQCGNAILKAIEKELNKKLNKE